MCFTGAVPRSFGKLTELPCLDHRFLRLCLAVLIATSAGCWLAPPAHAQDRTSALVGKPAPEFHVDGIFNETYSLEKFKGHILVMQFGASW